MKLSPTTTRILFLLLLLQFGKNERLLFSVVKRNSEDDHADRNPFIAFMDGEFGFDDFANRDFINRHDSYEFGKLLEARDSVAKALPTRANLVQAGLNIAPKSSSTVDIAKGTVGPVIQSTTKPVFQSTSQPLIPSTSKPVIQTTIKPVIQTTIKPVIQTTSKPVIQSTNTPAPDISNGINVLQQDNKLPSSSKGSSNSMDVPQLNSFDEYNSIFEYRALKRKEGEEWVLAKDSVQKFKAHPPPNVKQGPNDLPSRPSSVLWPGLNG